jgi:hypothetical protein
VYARLMRRLWQEVEPTWQRTGTLPRRERERHGRRVRIGLTGRGEALVGLMS